jgi:membrane protein
VHPTWRAHLLDGLAFLRFVWRRWNEDRCALVAGSLTYATLLALAPLFVIGVAMLSSLPMFEDVIDSVQHFALRNLVPDVARRLVHQNLDLFRQNAARLTTVGLIAVIFVALMLMLFIDRTLNGIWRVSRSRPYWLSVLSYLVLMTLGPLLIGASVTVTTYLSLSLGLSEPLPHSPWLRVVPSIVTSVAFFLVYRLLPHRHVPWQHAAFGAVVAGLLFEAAKSGFSAYVRQAPTYNALYGGLAALPIFLIWIYLSWNTILLGAELTAAAGYWEGRLFRQAASPALHFRHAIAVVRALLAAGGGAVTFRQLRDATRLPVHELEDTLMRLEEPGIVEREGRGAYRFGRAPGEITVAEVYTATVAPVGAMPPEEWAEVSPGFARAAQQMRQELQQPLVALGSTPPEAAVRKRKRGRGRSARSAR